MTIDRSALKHLLQARAALVSEIDRLTAARADLDSVIERVSASQASSVLSGQPVKAAARERRSVRRARPGTGQKSIRIHILELLGAEKRDFGMAEIIDRIHAQGVEAHDDAVRSITIKLMKDGTVERVGRGQYRLAEGTERAAGPPPEPPVAEPPSVAPAPPAPVRDVTRALNLAHPWN